MLTPHFNELEIAPAAGVTIAILYMGPVPGLSALVGEMPAENQPVSFENSPTIKEPEYEFAI